MQRTWGEDIERFEIKRAEKDDLREILELQYIAYQSEAELIGTKDIPPLKQTLSELMEEFGRGIILKIEDSREIIGSVRAERHEDTVRIGRLMVHPAYRRNGLGMRLQLEPEKIYPRRRYELFTSTCKYDCSRVSATKPVCPGYISLNEVDIRQ